MKSKEKPYVLFVAEIIYSQICEIKKKNPSFSNINAVENFIGTEKYKEIPIETSFQSRFGPQEWLTPYTDKTLESLPGKGIKNLLVICPGFASDCVETLEEINIQGRESFLKNGGVNFDLIPCLNDNSDHIDLFEKLVSKYL